MGIQWMVRWWMLVHCGCGWRVMAHDSSTVKKHILNNNRVLQQSITNTECHLPSPKN
jgi:hypothetical protein